MFLKKENESQVKRQSAFEQLRPVMAPVKQKLKCTIYTPYALWPLSPPITSTWHCTEPYDIFSKSSYNDTQFK